MQVWLDLESAGRVMTLVINDDPQPAQANYIAVSTASWRTRVDNWRYPKVREDFTITEKAFTSAFSWLKAHTIAFTFTTLLRHYAKWAPSL